LPRGIMRGCAAAGPPGEAHRGRKGGKEKSVVATEGKGTVLPPGGGETVSLPGNEISFVRRQPDGAYSLVEWVAAPGPRARRCTPTR